MSKKSVQRTRRTQVIWRYTLISFAILLFAGLITRSAVMTTVISVEDWNKKADKQLSRIDTIKPMRGEILACDGSILATNVNFYNIRIDFKSSQFMEEIFRENLQALSDTLAVYHPHYTSTQWYERLEQQVNKSKKSSSFLLLKNLTYEQSEKVRQYPFFKESKNNNRTGFCRETKIRRCYPYGDMARRSVGRVCEKENGQIRGLSGLEYALDSMLYGHPGIYKKVALTRNIVNWTDVPARNGYTLTTTIDIAMQDIVETELNAMLDSTKAKWGTCVLMEVATGDIKAISNLERDDETGKYIEAQNYAILGFEPGSVMKTLSMVVALEDGFVTNLDQMYKIGYSYAYAGGKAICDTHSPAELPVRRFLEYSSNIGMTKLVAPHFEDNPNRFRERLGKMGLFEKFNTGIAGERVPNFPTLYKEHGWLVSLSRQVYGYTSQIPPLYTCAFYNAIANDGRFVRPRLVSAIRTMSGDSILPVSYVRDHICSSENAAKVRAMLHDVVYGKAGTARMLRDDLVDIAGKTGTSKVAREADKDANGKPIKGTGGGYIDGAYHLTFCGFFPYEQPKYTCIVMISQPAPQFRSAGGTSGMVLKGIARKMYSHGMLDNSSNFRTHTKDKEDRPKVYSNDVSQTANIKSMIGVAAVDRIVVKDQNTGGVPNVVGLGLRQAVEILEKNGFEVKVEGAGYVASQIPESGTALKRGKQVTIKLTQNI